MKQTTQANAANNLDNLSEGQLKAIALMQFNGGDYFIVTAGNDDPIVYEGNEQELTGLWIEATDNPIENTWEQYCQENCTVVNEIDGTDEKDGYIVLTDEEADEMAANYITDSLWAFTPNFLSERTGLDREVFEAIQSNNKCESNNDTIYNIVQKLDDIDDFVQAAIGADGRGHFMSSYDGNENEETVNGTTYYIYRIN